MLLRLSLSTSLRTLNLANRFCSTNSLSPQRSSSIHDTIAQYYLQTTISNCKINYLKVGNGPHAVFCFPGLLGAMRTHLSKLIHNFNKHGDIYTFYAWDQPGYGQSRPPERTFSDESLQEETDMCYELLRRMGHEKYSVLGWSGGGLSALLLAAQHQNFVRKLIVWGAFAYVDKEDAEKFEWFKDLKNWPGKMQDVIVEEHGVEFVKKHWEIWMDIFIRIYSNNGGEFCVKQAHNIKCPTLLMHGTKDFIVLPKHAHFLQKIIPNSTVMLWEGGKHNLQLRYPEEFFAHVHKFLQE